MSRSDATYQVLERIFGRNLMWRVGRWMYCGARRELSFGLDANGEYALQERVARYLAKSPDHQPIILDVGANLGAWSRPFGQALRDAGAKDARLVAFEPGPGQRERLEVNLSGAVGFADVSILPYAVAAENGQGEFAITGEATGSSGLVPEAGTRTRDAEILKVEIRTLDTLLAELGIESVDYVKVDTEGNDPNVLEGAIETLRAGRIGAMQFEYNFLWLSNRFSLGQIFRFIPELDYRLGKIVPDGVELYDEWHFELDRYVMANFVLIRNDLCEALGARAYRFNGENVAVPVDG